jgi:hypothetical protein
MAKRKKAGREDQKKVSEKIALLRREGKDPKAAAGEAYGMLRAGRLGRHGAYRHVGRKGRRKGGRK